MPIVGELSFRVASTIGDNMAEQFTGRIQVQSEDDGLTTIILNGNNSDVLVGSADHAGAVIIRDDAGTDRVKIRPQTITVFDDAGQIVIQLDGPSGDVQFGAAGARGQLTVHNGQGVATILIGGGEATIELGADGQDGDLLVKDGDGAERIRLNGSDGSLTVFDAASGDQVILLNGNNAAFNLGGAGQDGDIRLKNSAGVETIHLGGDDARIELGADGEDGSVVVKDDQGQETIKLTGQQANLLLGGSGVDGDAFLFRGDGDRSDTATATINLDGQAANLLMGGQEGADGDVFLFREDGDRSDPATATIHLDGQAANLYMGGQLDADGDIWLFPEDGDRTDTSTASIHLSGETGDIILQNADVAEDFDVRDAEAIEPGTVVVIGDDSRLRTSSQSYDKRVAGVVTGAGSPRPGIILGRHASSRSRLPVALVGRVPCRVDATTAPILIGDLLTTSATPGHAMKADDPTRAHGAVIGKALQCQKEGTGTIPILVALQ
jgi:hypothetical protein